MQLADSMLSNISQFAIHQGSGWGMREVDGSYQGKLAEIRVVTAGNASATLTTQRVLHILGEGVCGPRKCETNLGTHGQAVPVDCTTKKTCQHRNHDKIKHDKYPSHAGKGRGRKNLLPHQRSTISCRWWHSVLDHGQCGTPCWWHLKKLRPALHKHTHTNGKKLWRENEKEKKRFPLAFLSISFQAARKRHQNLIQHTTRQLMSCKERDFHT